MPVNAKPGDGGVFPGDDDLTRRNAENRQRDVARRNVELERDDRGRGGDERLAGGTKDARARNVKLAHAPLDEFAV